MNRQKTHKGNKGNKESNVGAGAPSQIGERERARIERWRGHVARRLEEIAGLPAFIPAEWLEEIEQRPIADVITDWITCDRLTGFPGEQPKLTHARVGYQRECDEREEERGTLARNNHEKQIVHMAINAAMLRSGLVPAGRGHEFLRRFYRAGDHGIGNAERRAVRVAIDGDVKPVNGRMTDAKGAIDTTDTTDVSANR